MYVDVCFLPIYSGHHQPVFTYLSVKEVGRSAGVLRTPHNYFCERTAGYMYLYKVSYLHFFIVADSGTSSVYYDFNFGSLREHIFIWFVEDDPTNVFLSHGPEAFGC